MKKETYIIDKEHGSCDMYVRDRLDVHHIAANEPQVLGEFVKMLCATIRKMESGDSLIIECTLNRC